MRRRLLAALAASGCLVLGGLTSEGAPVVAAFERGYKSSSEEADRISGGRLLFTELNCLRCHSAPEAERFDSGGASARGGPHLHGLGRRRNPGWIRDFLTDPQKTKPGTTMPDVLHGVDPTEREEVIEDLVHFLLRTKGRAPARVRNADPRAGERTYHSIGCVACHDPLSQEDTERGGLLPRSLETSVPLGAPAGKYSLPSLTEFLLDPLAARPGGRMPSLGLSKDDAADVAAFLLGLKPERVPPEEEPFSIDKERGIRGEKAFSRFGCAQCHLPHKSKRGSPLPPATRGRELASLDGSAGGCLSGSPGSEAPQFALRQDQRAALQSYCDSVIEKSSPPGNAIGTGDRDVVRHTVEAFNCTACHERDGHGGVEKERDRYFTGDEAIGNEGRLPPHLTGVGRKLQTRWIHKVLTGEGKLRPYLKTRMPEFGIHNLPGLPELFHTADGGDREGAASEMAEVGDLEAGWKLTGVNGGMGCVTCHGWQDREGIAMRAVPISNIAERLQPGWFKRNLIDPASVRPGTLMPSFWPGGESGNKAVLGGDTDLQVASLWRYLSEGTRLPEGFPDWDVSPYEITPTGRAVVQRGFIHPAGTHAIAVGFPEGGHLLFDAASCRVVSFWSGRFIDAYKLWFSRRDPTAEPLGESLHHFGPEEGGLEGTGERVFQGYRIDPGTGAPTFLYRIGKTEVEDTFAAPGEGQHGVDRKIALPEGSSLVLSEGAPPGVQASVEEERHDGRGERAIQIHYRWEDKE